MKQLPILLSLALTSSLALITAMAETGSGNGRGDEHGHPQVQVVPHVVAGEVTRKMQVVMQINVDRDIRISRLSFQYRIDDSMIRGQFIPIRKDDLVGFKDKAVFDTADVKINEKARRLDLRIAVSGRDAHNNPFVLHSRWHEFRIVSVEELIEHSIGRMRKNQAKLADAQSLVAETGSALTKLDMKDASDATREANARILASGMRNIELVRSSINDSRVALSAEFTCLSATRAMDEDFRERGESLLESWEEIANRAVPAMVGRLGDLIKKTRELKNDEIASVRNSVSVLARKMEDTNSKTQKLSGYLELLSQLRRIIHDQKRISR